MASNIAIAPLVAADASAQDARVRATAREAQPIVVAAVVVGQVRAAAPDSAHVGLALDASVVADRLDRRRQQSNKCAFL